MTPKKELKLAYALAIVLLLIGAICYAAFPVKQPDNPIRKMFKTNAGKVLFTHKLHRSESGYGATCFDCHHHHEEDAETLRACGDCHQAEAPREVPKACLECHEPSETHHPKPEEGVQESADDEARACNDCHLVKEDGSLPQACLDCHEADEIGEQEKKMNFQKRSDAFHNQCINCHRQYGKGPVECSSCHVM